MEKIEAAQAELSRCAKEVWAGRQGWRWQIPANPSEDTDLIIGAGLAAGSDAVAQLAACREALKKADAIVAKFGDCSADLFEQLLKGNWVDDHGHAVGDNAAMLALAEPVKEAMAYRAEFKDVRDLVNGGS